MAHVQCPVRPVRPVQIQIQINESEFAGIRKVKVEGRRLVILETIRIGK